MPAATPARASIERRVSLARDASLQRSSSCARIGSVLTAAPEEDYPARGKSNPCEVEHAGLEPATSALQTAALSQLS